MLKPVTWTDNLNFSREARYPSLYSKFLKLNKSKKEKSEEFITLGSTHMHDYGPDCNTR